MTAVVIIFMIFATIFALASLTYVVVDIILEKRAKQDENKEEKTKKADIAEENSTVEVMPAILAHVDAEEADAMISDALAMKNAKYENGAGRGKQEIVNIGVINEYFNANDVVTLAVLKQKGLINKKAGRMKVLADGELTKPLTVKSESYSVQAIKMIELTGGTVIILKD